MKVADSVSSVWSRSSRRPRRPRLVAKDGQPLIANKITSKFRVNAKNWFLLTLECRWRTMLGIFFAGYFISFLFFALIYYVISVVHMQETKEDHQNCIANVNGFITALLYSIESQATIGYGYRYPTGRCPPAYITLLLQVIVGQLLETLLGGLIIAKILRPKKRKQEIRFSSCAVIGPLNDEDNQPMSLNIRLADIQDQLFFAGSSVKLYCATCRTEFGKRELLGLKEINVGFDPVLLLWPIVIRHVIDESSPFFGKTRRQVIDSDFELIMTVEGTDETTGATIQARSSYLPDEILWGRRFKKMVFLNEKRCKYEVDYELFDETEVIPGFKDLDCKSVDETLPEKISLGA